MYYSVQFGSIHVQYHEHGVYFFRKIRYKPCFVIFISFFSNYISLKEFYFFLFYALMPPKRQHSSMTSCFNQK